MQILLTKDSYYQATKLIDTRTLFERARSNDFRNQRNDSSLGDRVCGYGSIISNLDSPSVAASRNVQESATLEREPIERTGGSSPKALPDHIAASDVFLTAFPEVWDMDEEFWRLNDSLLGSFLMGNESVVPRQGVSSL